MEGHKRKRKSESELQKKRVTLSEKIAELTDPTPKDVDPEEPHWDSGRLNYDEYEEQDFSKSTSKGFSEAPTRKRIVADIVMGKEYIGKKISRNSLNNGSESDEAISDKEEEPISQPTFTVNLEGSSSDDYSNSDQEINEK